MKKSVKTIILILIIATLVIPITYSYATEKIKGNMAGKEFFEISEKEIPRNENIEMTINLGTINYNKFKFELKSSNSIENIKIDKEQNESTKSIGIDKNNKELIIEVDKEQTNLNKINLYYEIPRKC